MIIQLVLGKLSPTHGTIFRGVVLLEVLILFWDGDKLLANLTQGHVFLAVTLMQDKFTFFDVLLAAEG